MPRTLEPTDTGWKEKPHGRLKKCLYKSAQSPSTSLHAHWCAKQTSLLDACREALVPKLKLTVVGRAERENHSPEGPGSPCLDVHQCPGWDTSLCAREAAQQCCTLGLLQGTASHRGKAEPCDFLTLPVLPPCFRRKQ